jgi:transposase
MKTLHKRCAGLDVHKTEVVACLRVANRGKASYQLRRFPTTTRALIELGDWLEQAGCTHVAMEATGVYWKPVWHILEGRFQQILANAAHIKAVPGRKSDTHDATWISDLLAHGLIRPSFVPPQPIQEVRDLTRTRKQLTREIVQHTQRIQAVLEEANIKLTSVITDILGTSGRRILKAIVAGETNPTKLAELGGPRLAATKSQLADALLGRVRPHHRFLIDHLPKLRQIGFAANRRLLEVERVSHDCLLAEHTFQAINNPVAAGRQRASGLPICASISSCRPSSCSGNSQKASVQPICAGTLRPCPHAIPKQSLKAPPPINCAACACTALSSVSPVASAIASPNWVFGSPYSSRVSTIDPSAQAWLLLFRPARCRQPPQTSLPQTRNTTQRMPRSNPTRFRQNLTHLHRVF